MEMPDSTYSEELNPPCSGAAVDVDRYLEKEVLMLRTKIQNLAKKYRAARDVLRDFRAEMKKHQNAEAHRSAPGGEVERKGNDGKTN